MTDPIDQATALTSRAMEASYRYADDKGKDPWKSAWGAYEHAAGATNQAVLESAPDVDSKIVALKEAVNVLEAIAPKK